MCSFFFFCKQKTAYDMRISDWSSDVCSSDLRPRLVSSVSGGKRMIRRFNDEGIERLGGGNIRIECVGHFTGSEFALAEAIADCRDGKIGEISGHYSITFGTAKKPCSA